MQTVLASVAIDSLASKLLTRGDEKWSFNADLFASLNKDDVLAAEIAQGVAMSSRNDDVGLDKKADEE